LSKLPSSLLKLCKNSKPCLNFIAFNIPAIYGKYNLLILMDIYNLGEGDVSRLSMERPTIKGTKMTICHFSSVIYTFFGIFGSVDFRKEVLKKGATPFAYESSR
jgi:hypothetical protein